MRTSPSAPSLPQGGPRANVAFAMNLVPKSIRCAAFMICLGASPLFPLTVEGILLRFGFETGEFSRGDPLISDLEFEDRCAGNLIMSCEGDANLIDSAAEFVTANFYYRGFPYYAEEEPLIFSSLWEGKLAVLPFSGLTAIEASERGARTAGLLSVIREVAGTGRAEAEKYYREHAAIDLENRLREIFGSCRMSIADSLSFAILRTDQGRLHIVPSSTNPSRENMRPVIVSSLDELSELGFSPAEIAEAAGKMRFVLDSMPDSAVKAMRDVTAGFFLAPNQAGIERMAELYAQLLLYSGAHPVYKDYAAGYARLLSELDGGWAAIIVAKGDRQAKSSTKPSYLSKAELSALLVPTAGEGKRMAGAGPTYDISAPPGRR
jgi:hypothetical protein